MQNAFEKKIIIVKGPLEPLRLFAERLGEGFTSLSYDVYYIEDTSNVNSDEIIRFLDGKNCVCLGFNNAVAFFAETEFGKRLVDQLGIPVINILVDNPVYFITELLSKKNDVVISIDMEQMKYIADNYPNIPISAFMPHGGTRQLEYPYQKKMEARDIDILYAGSIHIYKGELAVENIEPFCDYPFEFEWFKKKLVNKLLMETDLCLFEAVDSIIADADISIDFQSKQILYYNLTGIERIVCSVYRERLVYELAKSGARLTLCGGNWEKYTDLISMPNVTFLGMVSPQQVLDMMADSKIVVNHMTWFKHGSHERLFNGMLAGAMVVSDGNKYLSENFICQKLEEIEDTDEIKEMSADGNNINKKAQIFTYKLGDEHILSKKLNYLLNNIELMKLVAKNGYEEASDKHTWYHRAKELDQDLISMMGVF